MARLQTEYERSIRTEVRTLKDSEEKLKTYFSRELESRSLFIMPFDQSNNIYLPSGETLVKALSPVLTFRTNVINMPDFPENDINSNDFLINYLAFENIEPAFVKQILLNKIQEISGVRHRSIRYNKYGLFIPRSGRVICFSFAHSGSMYYRYRLAEFKLKMVPSGLSDYLMSLLSYCPDEYFYSGSRASGFILDIKSQMEHTCSHKISALTKSALKAGKFKSGHENVEKYLLEYDPETIACEVPVWYEQPPNSKLRINGILTGHIDILRYENDGRIGIWDYKPRARYEKKAHMQVYLYALMLSQRTGIPLNRFLCGYFDVSDAYFFNSEDVVL